MLKMMTSNVLPDPVKRWPRDILKPPKSSHNRHLYYAFDPEPDDPPDEDVPEKRFQGQLKSTLSCVSHWRWPEHERSPSKKAPVLDEAKMKAYVAKAFKEWGWGTDDQFYHFVQREK